MSLAKDSSVYKLLVIEYKNFRSFNIDFTTYGDRINICEIQFPEPKAFDEFLIQNNLEEECVNADSGMYRVVFPSTLKKLFKEHFKEAHGLTMPKARPACDREILSFMKRFQ